MTLAIGLVLLGFDSYSIYKDPDEKHFFYYKGGADVFFLMT